MELLADLLKIPASLWGQLARLLAKSPGWLGLAALVAAGLVLLAVRFAPGEARKVIAGIGLGCSLAAFLVGTALGAWVFSWGPAQKGEISPGCEALFEFGASVFQGALLIVGFGLSALGAGGGLILLAWTLASSLRHKRRSR